MYFEESFQKLSEVTEKLETGGLSLEEAVSLYEEGAKLAESCKRELENAKLKIQNVPIPGGDKTPDAE